MNTAHKGRRNEYKTRKLLEADGFVVTRSAGSKGAVDLIGIKSDSIVLIQVKTNTPCPANELMAFRNMSVPPCCRKAVYVWKDYQTEPNIFEVN